MADDLATKLAAIAEAADTEEDPEDEAVWVKARRKPRDPSMVYSVRIPVGRVEELRRVAADRGIDASALVRSWVLGRLDQEAADPAVAHAAGAVEELVEALARVAGRSDWTITVAPASRAKRAAVAKGGAAVAVTSKGRRTAV